MNVVPCFSRTTAPHMCVVGRAVDGGQFRKFLNVWEELRFLRYDKEAVSRLAAKSAELQLTKTQANARAEAAAKRV